MLDFNLLKNLLIIAMAVSTITVIFIQKTKRFIPKSSLIPLYSLFINLLGSYLFSLTFATNISIIETFWIGIFAFLGADGIYNSLEGKLSSYTDLINKNQVIGEITYD